MNKSVAVSRSALSRLRPQSLFSLTAMLVAFAGINRTEAADVLWDGGASGTGSVWTTAANWAGDAVPTGADNAVFDNVQGVALYTLNSTSQQVGCVTVGTGRTSNFSIRSLSSANGTLQLNGVGGMLISNASSASITFQNTATWATSFKLNLAASGNIYANNNGSTPPDTAGSVVVIGAITETGGPRSLTLTGPGIVYFQTNNFYTGSTTISNGTLELDDYGTIGDGTGTVFLSGGNIQCALDRSGTTASSKPIANPIVLTSDAYIYNRSGNPNSNRRFPLSGSLGGTSGTLKIANLATASGQTFVVRLFGNFTFGRPILVGETTGTFASLSASVLELCNSNGVQTFNGVISGPGSLLRANPINSAAVGGVSILTGNNTYSGGTTIGNGTIFANNLLGSALGGGSVTITNLGTLAGSGAVVASTSVSLNGTISPGATSNSIANFAVSDLTLGNGANYIWQIASATGTPGSSWDVITCSSGWTDAANIGSSITIKIDSLGAVPAGWNSNNAYDWIILQGATANGFDASHFTVDASGFSGAVAGGFNTYVSGGALHLTYTPGFDFVINVPTGSASQIAGYGTITGTTNVVKVGNGEIVFDNNANTYSGNTKILAGTLSLSVDAPNGSGALGANVSPTFLGNTTGASNATLNINTDGVTDGHSITVQAGSTGTLTIGTTLTSGTANYSGDILLNTNATLSAATGGSAVFSGNITGPGGLTLGGGGTITLSALNAYTGPTTLTGGTLNLNAKALGTNTFTISAPSTVDNTSAGNVTLNSAPMNWNANFNFGGTANLNLGAGAVTMNANRTLNISNAVLTVGGPISGPGFGLTKVGAGTLVLASATTNSYTGGTTNSGGVLGINSTATFGNGSSPLVMLSGNLLNTGSRSGSPIANPVFLNSTTTIYGDSTASAPSTRILPFTGPFNVGANTLKIGNTGLANNTFILRFQGSNYTTINWPIVIGDDTFDTAGAITELDLWNDNSTPVQTVSGLITGTGSINRGASSLNTGGTTIFTAQNTFPGGVHLDSGAVGFGASTVSSGGAVVSGPVGTGTMTLGANNGESTLTIFPSGGPRVIENRIVLNGITNVVISGNNDLTLAGPFNSGGVAKNLIVSNTGITTISGSITNTGTGAGGALTKLGNGTLVFSGDNTYPGTTTVNAGTLLINTTTGSGTSTNLVTVNTGGTLGGTGYIAGPVIVNAGGIIGAGASIGTLTISNDLTLAGSVAVEVNTAANPSNDLIFATGIISNAANASVTVSNLGPALTVGKKFQIFSAPVLNGSTMSVSGGGVNWTNTLETDGSIAVLSVASTVNTNSFVVGAVISGNNLNLSWPPDRLGWKVQLQTNSLGAGLGNNWVTLPSTATATNYTVPLNPANPTVFIRMVYP